MKGFIPPICQVIGWCYIPPPDTVSSSRQDFTFFVLTALSFLSYMPVVRYPVRCNHPALRIKRIRLSVNQVDRIMVVGVTTQ